MLERRDGSKPPPGTENLSSSEIAEKCSVCNDYYCENILRMRCMKKYYDGMRTWTMGPNYYVNTFIGTKNDPWHGNKGDFYWTYHK